MFGVTFTGVRGSGSAGHGPEHHQGHSTLPTSLHPPWVAPLQSLLAVLLALSTAPVQLHCPNSARCCHWKAFCVHRLVPGIIAQRHFVLQVGGTLLLWWGRWNQAFSPQALKLMECPCHSLGLCPYAHYNITVANETRVPSENMLEKLRNLHMKPHLIFSHAFLMYHPRAMECRGARWFCHHCVSGKGIWDHQWNFDCPYSPYWQGRALQLLSPIWFWCLNLHSLCG